MNFFRTKPESVIAAEDALPGRDAPIKISGKHFVNGSSMLPPFPAQMETIIFGMGCFWGAERLFWEVPGVFTTSAGYSGGTTPNPTYPETCTSRTGHTEAVIVVFDPAEVDLDALFKVFWENHDPTQLMGQGNDLGSQYRTAIYGTNETQLTAAQASLEKYQSELTSTGFGEITTEIAEAGEFYYAEEEHQQYLAKNPYGYCNHGFCQVAYS
ncbi:MAG: peptide-methionine (S)-S-oxide reductase MsrA [Chloroflexi bacterium]|nr:peptide-methionine (S)-S-oxide reductase MsrA [Chloroflexota bacterium]MDA1281873.1 peptide-methionine (S)-S-oxide reductase MsrA [Chloroflexota bacterium]